VPPACGEGATQLTEDGLGATDDLRSVARRDERNAATSFSCCHASTTSISVFRCNTPGSPVGLKTLNATVRSCQSYRTGPPRLGIPVVPKTGPQFTVGAK